MDKGRGGRERARKGLSEGRREGGRDGGREGGGRKGGRGREGEREGGRVGEREGRRERGREEGREGGRGEEWRGEECRGVERERKKERAYTLYIPDHKHSHKRTKSSFIGTVCTGTGCQRMVWSNCCAGVGKKRAASCDSALVRM